jgi:hypothetical protein
MPNCARCQRLEAELQAVRAALLQARGEQDVRRLRSSLGVSEQNARMLLTLYAEGSRPVSMNVLRAAMPPRTQQDNRASSYVHAQLYRLRQTVGSGFVETIRPSRLRLTFKGYSTIAAALTAPATKVA